MDIKKVMQEMHEASSEAEKKQIIDKVKAEFNSLTEEEKKNVRKLFLLSLDDKMEEAKKVLKEIDLKIEMMEISQYVSLAMIAKNYFGKSKNWLYQRIYGYNVNGKPAKFILEERGKLSLALEDISRMAHETSFKIA
ncbi:MAG: DUF5053 domain-containing protein [Candidatus Azobacteroides sp.]|nr:DUF5053 domain-containing protein [Candidatus Azobacteroides sp.]